MLRTFLLATAALGILSALSWAGTYGTQGFAYANGTTNVGGGTTLASTTVTGTDATASVQAGALRLTANGTGGTAASFKLPDLDPSKEVAAFDVSFQLRFFASGTPADGFSLSFGAVPAGNGGGEGGFVMPNGLVIAWDTYNNGGDVPSIEIFANGTSVGNFPQTFAFDGAYRQVNIHWDASGLDVTVGGVAICTNLATPGFTRAPGNTFAFSGRTGGATQDTYIDDLLISTTPVSAIETGGPVIAEFVADNTELKDEDVETPDWIEIYNGQNASVNLAGWTLTNNAGTPGMWTFPSVTLAPYEYRVVFASGKNRTVASAPLHTNFTLIKAGGYVGLYRPGGVLASQYTYGAQKEDVAYGETGVARTVGYLAVGTPGDKNTSTVAAGPPAEDVVWSREGGLITGATSVTIAAPLEAGAVIRYTTNNTEPSESSPVYNPASPPAAFTFSSNTTLRARIFATGKLPGDVSSRTFLRLENDLVNYAGTGQPFNSSLPILVMDSLGVPVDAYTAEGGRPFRYTYAVTIDNDPTSGRAVITSPIVDFTGRGGTHVRGESSAGFEQRSYAWETWDNDGKDKDSAILGMPAESDWVLLGPYGEKTMMRNYLIQTLGRMVKPEYGMRCRLVEVFFNQESGQNVSYSDYRGVYLLVEKIKINKERVDLAQLGPLTTDPALISGGYLFRRDKPDPGKVEFTTTNQGIPLQFHDPETPNTAQFNALSGAVNAFEAALYGANFTSPTLGYAAHIDVDSFIDNHWFVEMSKQIDGYRISTYFAKDRGGKIRSIPIWDYNLAFGNANYLAGDQYQGWYYTQVGGTDYYWYARLFQDPNYVIRRWDRYWELRRGVYSTAHFNAVADAAFTLLQDGSTADIGNNQHPSLKNPVARHFTKYQLLGNYQWPNAGGDPAGAATLTPRPWQTNTTFTAEVAWMKNWFAQRLNWIDDQNFVGSVIYRPPTFSLAAGNVPAGSSLTITRYTGTPPGGFTYATGGTLYYTTNGTDPRNSSGGIAGTAYSTPLTLNTSTEIRARLYLSGTWSPMMSATYIVNAQPASAANLAITEVHYDPSEPSLAELAAGYNSAKDFEYIELQNVGATAVNLSGLLLQDAAVFDFNTISNPATLTLGVGQRILLVGNQAAYLYRNGAGANIAGQFAGSLANEGELITLRAANGGIIAQFTWGATGQWPSAPGYSMVLNNPGPNPAYGSGASWRSSAAIGGSPGQSNSVAFTGAPNGDTDKDQFSDYLEYALGSDWQNATSNFQPTVGIETHIVAGVPGSYLTFRFRRNLAADGVFYTPQYCATAGGWDTAPLPITFVSSVNNGDGTSTETWRSSATWSPGTGFARLKVSPTP